MGRRTCRVSENSPLVVGEHSSRSMALRSPAWGFPGSFRRKTPKKKLPVHMAAISPGPLSRPGRGSPAPQSASLRHPALVARRGIIVARRGRSCARPSPSHSLVAKLSLGATALQHGTVSAAPPYGWIADGPLTSETSRTDPGHPALELRQSFC